MYYYHLMKPGILFGNLLTVIAGFFLGTGESFHFVLFLMTLLGIGFLIASACIFNNILDKDIDQKMARTKDRPLVTGSISPLQALYFGAILGALGNATLFFGTNGLTTLVADIGFITYVVLYTPLKRVTVFATAIGSIAGATPAVVGYTAASGRFDLAALLLFFFMVFWQMPHFFSIAFYRETDYKNAGIPLLPIVRGALRTKIHMILYIIAFTATCVLLTVGGYTKLLFLAVSLALGLYWLFIALKGLQRSDNRVWGRQMMLVSLVVITVLSLLIPLDRVL